MPIHLDIEGQHVLIIEFIKLLLVIVFVIIILAIGRQRLGIVGLVRVIVVGLEEQRLGIAAVRFRLGRFGERVHGRRRCGMYARGGPGGRTEKGVRLRHHRWRQASGPF